MRNNLIVVMSILILGVGLPSEVRANEFGVNLYGISYHFLRESQSRDPFNEVNTGIGFRATFGGRNSSRLFFEGGRFKDTLENTAKYMSIGFLLKIIHQFRVGLNGAIYTSKSIRNGNAFFAPLPIASYSLWRVTVNGVYMPKYQGTNPYHTLGFYLTIRLFEGTPTKKR